MPIDPKTKSRAYHALAIAPAALMFYAHTEHLSHPPDTGCIFINAESCGKFTLVPVSSLPDRHERHPGGSPVYGSLAYASGSSTLSVTQSFGSWPGR